MTQSGYYTLTREVLQPPVQERFSSYFRNTPEAFSLICSYLNKGGK